MCGVEVHTVNSSPPFGLEGEGTKGRVIGNNGENIEKGKGLKRILGGVNVTRENQRRGME